MLENARQMLLESAATLLCDLGIERVNTNQIAKAAGVGVGTFYGQFHDKHDLHRELVLYAVDELTRHLADQPRPPAPVELQVEVRAWVEGILSFGEAHPRLFRAAFGREPRSMTGAPAVGLSMRPVERRLQALRSAGKLAEGIDPAIAARGYAAMLTSLACWWLAEPARAERSQLVDTLVGLHPALAGRTPA